MMLVRSFMGRGARICCVGVVQLGMRRPTLCSKNLLLLLLLLLLSNSATDRRRIRFETSFIIPSLDLPSALISTRSENRRDNAAD